MRAATTPARPSSARWWSSSSGDPRSGRTTHAQILCLLFGVAFLIWILYAQADPFLHNWDERFHALVARNLMQDPFKPTLIASPVAAYDFRDWTGNNIWLHKQPLFMWQMALSMKVFGVSELALRLPSVPTGSRMVVLLFRIAFLLTANTTISLLAATLLCFSHFHLELIAGIHAMDHNDVALGFYVLASLWAWAEYRRDGRWHWATLVGVFAGCAVLNKWLVGLTVFLGWGAHLLSTMRQKSTRRETGHFLLALLVCGAVFVPWQVYITRTWPTEAKYLRNLREGLPGDVRIELNTNDLENLDLMFYNKGITAYPRLTEGEFQALSRRNVPVAAFKSDGKHELPAYVSAYPFLYVIDRGYAFREVPY